VHQNKAITEPVKLQSDSMTNEEILNVHNF